jgi:AAA+ ATPase superfamily predicted ATPase
MNVNPFTFGNPIRGSSRFHGRKNEIRQIINRLMSSAHESTSIVGERRIGKTSLLNYLSDSEIAANLGLSGQFCLVYIDFQGLTDITPLRFWRRVLTIMARNINSQELVQDIDQLSKQESFDLFDLEDLFEKINNRGLIIVLFMDEFEYVTQNPKFKADFFGGLRALAIHHNLALVPATRRELVDLCHSDEIKGSPFFNIFANVVLRPFLREEVDELIDDYIGGTEFAFTPQEKEFVAQLGGGYPFFMQIAGYYILEGKKLGLDSKSLHERVTANFDQQAAPHFRYLWSHCTESEKITLLATLALQRMKPTKDTRPNLDNLERLHPRAYLDVSSLCMRGLLSETNGEYSLVSHRFDYWISQEVVAAPGEEESQESVDGWLKSVGQEKFEPAQSLLPKFKKKYWPVVGILIKEISFEIAGAAGFEILKNLLI